jgi:hypothetical protein
MGHSTLSNEQCRMIRRPLPKENYYSRSKYIKPTNEVLVDAVLGKTRCRSAITPRAATDDIRVRDVFKREATLGEWKVGTMYRPSGHEVI